MNCIHIAHLRYQKAMMFKATTGTLKSLPGQIPLLTWGHMTNSLVDAFASWRPALSEYKPFGMPEKIQNEFIACHCNVIFSTS